MKREEARRRAAELVNQMTLEERASQLRYDAPAIERLGIPAYNWWGEALHGVARAGIATVFPQAIGMAATFDEELLQEVADCVAEEGRAKYNEYSAHNDRDIYKGLTFWSPNVNIFRDPRWGRGHETYGEDPYLTSRLGVAYVKGLQGDGEVMKTAACAKHFAVHSGPEAIRHEFNAEATPKDMEETYLPAFEALVKEAGVEAVMGAYNRVNGEPCCGSNTLIRDILRDKWQFQGHYVSDCWAIRDFHENHMVTSTPAESAAMAINAGCDLNCGVTYLHLLTAYQQGLVTEETITEAAVRLYTTRFLLGLFDKTGYDAIPYEKVECEEHIALADKVAKKSIVLLKNNGLLPLDLGKIKTIGVIGPNANSRKALVGNYHGTSSEYITLLEGIQRYAQGKARVLFSEGCALFEEKTENLALAGDRLQEARIVAEHSDVVIMCLGLDETLEGEEGDTGNSYASGDKVDLLLPKPQRDLMEVVAGTGKPVVFCLMVGSAIDLSYPMAHFDAILQLWYPGARGGKSAADILFGETSPSGKLPVTFYHDAEHLPAFTDYHMAGRTYRYMEEKAQYPFGFGLTYGDVAVTDVKVTNISGEKDCFGLPDITIKVTAENHGKCDTEDVIQLYVKNTISEHAVKNPSLCTFKRILIKAGERVETELVIKGRAFSVVDGQGQRIKDGGHFALYAGTSQPDERSRELVKAVPIKIELDL
ncbi:MAG: glycoside hydrolase family 3 C-terminal domain-containing protein [Roseburia sp.]|nr:glycoside hydrolase family 3 C-terminal domain-containing protein [Roseburia sp.]MCM1241462.1 glycoside hydrolase family 3 C-terminal domain-containing protein [Roseburia sp.]